ncbi:hypothetical protein VTL71DRAFT_11630 [Oculimacula yallundae]|uniref:Uncharacterized protein n=1 Tax=Oculimacula yallundae TaxID=86028 RepID=A0ABR4CRT2_9HELO
MSTLLCTGAGIYNARLRLSGTKSSAKVRMPYLPTLTSGYPGSCAVGGQEVRRMEMYFGPEQDIVGMRKANVKFKHDQLDSRLSKRGGTGGE